MCFRIECHIRDELVIDCLEEGIRKEKPEPGLVIHVDQGSQYTVHRFFEVTQHKRFILSHSQKGNPYDNAVMESYI
jgi:putative transposase